MLLRAVGVILLGSILQLPGRGAPRVTPHWDTFRYSPTVSIRYFIAGTGPEVMVMLHGLASSADTWRDLLHDLDCNCTYYALDLKGHGGSSAPDDHAYTVDDNAAIVRAFLQARQLRGVILAGHSYGGTVALRTALDYNAEPDRIRALLLLGTPGTKQHFPLYMTTLRYQRPARFFEKFTPAELSAWIALRKMYYDRHAATPARIAQYANLWRDPQKNRAMRETGSEFLRHGLKEIAAETRNVHVPTLVIAGAKDAIVRTKQQKKLAGRIPNAQYVTIPACGHVPQEERPRETARDINAFVNSLATHNTSVDSM
jgi:pimeloyl-ACP methyl ester carboxylesterase